MSYVCFYVWIFLICQSLISRAHALRRMIEEWIFPCILYYVQFRQFSMIANDAPLFMSLCLILLYISSDSTMVRYQRNIKCVCRFCWIHFNCFYLLFDFSFFLFVVKGYFSLSKLGVIRQLLTWNFLCNFWIFHDLENKNSIQFFNTNFPHSQSINNNQQFPRKKHKIIISKCFNFSLFIFIIFKFIFFLHNVMQQVAFPSIFIYTIFLYFECLEN